MALRSNGNTFSSTGVQHFGVTAALSAYPHVLNQNFAQTNRIRNLTAGQGITDDKVGLPMGYVDKGWMMPQKAGMISSRGANFGFTDTGTILGGKALETTPPEPSFGFTTVATGGLVSTVPAAGAPATFGFSTNAPLLTASLSGDGSATFGFSFANALLGALGGMTVTAEFGMDGTLTSHAIGIMEGTTADSGVTVDNVVSGVWNALLVDYPSAGSAGLALATASSGGVDPSILAAAVWAYVNRTLTSTSAPTAADIVAAIEAAIISVNVKQVNDVAVTGTGATGDEWGPA